MGSTKLEEYQALEPKNREQRRHLLKVQGWYFHIVYMSYVVRDAWTVYKVYANGRKEKYDDWTGVDTVGR